MPPEVAQHKFFSVSNAENWVDLKQYESYLHNLIGRSDTEGWAGNQIVFQSCRLTMYCSMSAPPKSAPLDALMSIIDKLQAMKNVRLPNECESSEDLMVIAIQQNIKCLLHLSSPVP